MTSFMPNTTRMVAHLQQVIRQEAGNDPAFAAQWLVPGANVADGIQNSEWNGERLFQAAKFSTEMQYQHLVFENYARLVQPSVDAFEAHDVTINPAIVAEFAHTVFRFGHSLLRDASTASTLAGNVVDGDPQAPGAQQLRR